MKSSSRNASRRHSVARLLAVVPTFALFAIAVGACGDDAQNRPLPIFEGGPGLAVGSEGGSEAGTSEAGDAIADAPVNETSTNPDGATSPDGSSGTGTLVISQVRSRGTGGGNDEFIEIYNSGASPVTLDNTWQITLRNATSCSPTGATLLYSGANQVIASHKHFLITTSSYSGTPTGDGNFSAGISDAASVLLVHAGTVADALCFNFDAPTLTVLTTCSTPYTCEGTPVLNPHDNTSSGVSGMDVSLERKPGGVGGNGTDNNDNSLDFQTANPDDAHDLASAATP